MRDVGYGKLAAHAHGWKPPAGATACWSFYPTKTLGALGDAGAVTTNDHQVARKLQILIGTDDQLRDPRQINSRMDEIHASVLRVKLRYLDSWIDERREIAKFYHDELPSSVQLIPGQVDGFNHHVVVQCEDRDALLGYLFEHGIQTKVHFPTPLHKLDGPWKFETSGLPGAESWCRCVLSLPCYPGLPPESVKYITGIISARV